MRGLVLTIAVLAGLWCLLVVAAWGLQRQLVYLPDGDRPPAPAGLAVEEVELETRDGLELTAWWVPAEGAAASTVLVLPGNAGNRGLRAPLAAGLVARGHHVLLLDYRGYGGNPGRPHEEGLLADARAAREHLLARDEVDPARLAYLGESVGSAVAAGLAAEHPPAALVLRSPFDELATVGRRHYPFLPVDLLLRERHPTDRYLAEVETDLLVVAGGGDGIVPPELSQRVAERHGAVYEEIPGVGHNDRALLDGAAYLDAVDAFLRDRVAS